MPDKPEVDELDQMDLAIALDALRRHFATDGIDRQEACLLVSFQEPIERQGTRYRARRAFEAVLKNGVNRYTSRMANGVGITVVTTTEGVVTEVMATEAAY